MAARAVWKGYLKVDELICPVALYTAVSTSERVSFHTINRKTGNRVKRQFVDRETGEEVERDEQVKGYETGPDQYVVFEPEEIAAAVPQGDKTLSVEAFVPCDQVDDLYFDRPYYLAPADKEATEAYALIRDGLQRKNVAALAHAVLFRRARSLLIRALDDGLTATTLNYDCEVRSADEAFEDVEKIKIDKEMLDLARHIIETKRGEFDPTEFDDRYEAAVVELVRAKAAGREIKAPKRRAPEKVVDLMEALRRSAGVGGSEKSATKPATKTTKRRTAAKGKPVAAPRRKAG